MTTHDASVRDDHIAIVVEDHPLLRKQIARVINKVATAVTCGTYAEAIDTIDHLAARPLALIVDVFLGAGAGGDGLQVAEHAQRRFGGYVPTLVLTGCDGLATISERAQRLRAELLVKPQDDAALSLFIDRARTRCAWNVPDVIDLDRAIDELARDHQLTARQRELLLVMMSAAERGEQHEINTNTRKAALRRILARTGQASFRDLRSALKRRANHTTCVAGCSPGTEHCDAVPAVRATLRPMIESAPRLRRATHADVPAIVAVVQSAYRGDSSRAGWTTEADFLDGQRTDAADVLSCIERAQSLVLLAECEGTLVACAHVAAEDGAGYFGMFSVTPTLQGGGIGSRILAEAERIARDEWRLATMRMTVIDIRSELIAFYERRGYARTGIKKPFPYGDERFGLPRRTDLRFEVLEKRLARAGR